MNCAGQAKVINLLWVNVTPDEATPAVERPVVILTLKKMNMNLKGQTITCLRGPSWYLYLTLKRMKLKQKYQTITCLKTPTTGKLIGDIIPLTRIGIPYRP